MNVIRAVAAALACGLTACGSHPCDSPPAPCGGDLVGTWQAVDTCYMPGCGVTYSKTPTNSSQLTFRADGTVTAAFNLAGPISFTEPVSCLTGGNTKCSDMNEPNTNGNSLMCTGDTVCQCEGTISLVETSQTPIPYTTQGPNVTLGTAAGSTLGYCVSGDHLYLQFTATSGVGGSSTMVLAKQ
jgi:hypothetical protein